MNNSLKAFVRKTACRLKSIYCNVAGFVEATALKIEFRITGRTLSPKGECAYRYYQRIVNGEWREQDYIEEYESSLAKAMEALAKEGCIVNREEAAEDFCRIMELMPHAA